MTEFEQMHVCVELRLHAFVFLLLSSEQWDVLGLGDCTRQQGVSSLSMFYMPNCLSPSALEVKACFLRIKIREGPQKISAM